MPVSGFSSAREDLAGGCDGHPQSLELARLGGETQDSQPRHGTCHIKEHRGDGPCP